VNLRNLLLYNLWNGHQHELWNILLDHLRNLLLKILGNLQFNELWNLQLVLLGEILLYETEKPLLMCIRQLLPDELGLLQLGEIFCLNQG
jgi:hypothetical protein